MNIESNDMDTEEVKSSSLEDLPNNPPTQNWKNVLLEKCILFYKKSRIVLLDLLDLKHIDKKLPQKWLEKLPENRRLITLPIFILLIGFLLIVLLAIFAPTVSKKTKDKFVPIVRVINAQKESLHIPVYSQGIVNPKNEIKLISLVTGPVTYVSPNFVDGGYVSEGELLLAISDRTYQQDKARVEANLAHAKAIQVAKQSELRVRGTLRTEAGVSQLREVNSSVKAAEADVEKIDDLIASTQFRAPFSGLIRSANMQVGQRISAGTLLGSVYSVDTAIVSLPLSDRQLNLVALPEVSMIEKLPAEEKNNVQSVSDEAEESHVKAVQKHSQHLPKVKIIGDFDGKQYFWEGRLVRSAGGRNELNRLQYVIVEIDNPYGKDDTQPERPPLSPGFFIQAEIEGKKLNDIIKLPRKALKPNQKIWGVDKENYLVPLNVEIIHKGKDFIYVASGIEDNAEIMISDLDVLAEGIEVKSVAAKLTPHGMIEDAKNSTIEKTTSEKNPQMEKQTEINGDENK